MKVGQKASSLVEVKAKRRDETLVERLALMPVDRKVEQKVSKMAVWTVNWKAVSWELWMVSPTVG